MLSNFRIILLFQLFVYLGLHSSEFVHEPTIYSTSLLTEQQIIDAYHAGVAADATHMLIVWDTWDYENFYNFIVYSYPDEDVNTLIDYYNAPGFYRVSAVFALHPNTQ